MQFRPLGQDDAMTPDELVSTYAFIKLRPDSLQMRSLFAALSTDEFAPRIHGPAGNANLGDYVLSQRESCLQ